MADTRLFLEDLLKFNGLSRNGLIMVWPKLRKEGLHQRLHLVRTLETPHTYVLFLNTKGQSSYECQLSMGLLFYNSRVARGLTIGNRVAKTLISSDLAVG